MRKNKKQQTQQRQFQYKTASDYAPDLEAYRSQVDSRMSGGKKAAIIVLVSILVILLSAGSAFAIYMNYIGNNLNRGDKSDTELAALDEVLGVYDTSLDKPFYMMLLGSDKRANEKGNSRSDTNIVCRVDPIEYKVTMLSIPRDTKIDIDGHGTQKFNAAYAFDGAAGAIREAENLLGVDITHYAEVNFMDLAGLVDAVGGITVENESRIDNRKCDDGDGNHYVIEEGTVELNGGQALTFARNRDYPDGDFRRQAHQRQVVEAVVDKVLDLNITQIPGVIEAATKCVTTDLNVMDIIGLAQNFAGGKELVIYSGMLPSYTQTINGISFVINDEERTLEMLELFKAGEDISEIVSSKSAAPAINTSSIDTSNTLRFEDDDEPTHSSGTSGGSANGSGSAGSSGSTTAPDPAPEQPGGSTGGSSGSTTDPGSSSGGSTGGSEGGSSGSTGGGSSTTDPASS